MDRRVRACDRLTRLCAVHKTRLKDLVRQLLPLSPLDGDLTNADLAVLLATGADPHHLARLGKARLTRLIAQASRGHFGAVRAQHWLDAASEAVEAVRAQHGLDAASEAVEAVRAQHGLDAASEGSGSSMTTRPWPFKSWPRRSRPRPTPPGPGPGRPTSPAQSLGGLLKLG